MLRLLLPLLAVLLLSLPALAKATCMTSCELQLVDASCNPLSNTEAPSPFYLTGPCEEQCCAGGPDCSTNPQPLSSEMLIISSSSASTEAVIEDVASGCGEHKLLRVSGLDAGDYSIRVQLGIGSLSVTVANPVNTAEDERKDDDSGCSTMGGSTTLPLWLLPSALLLLLRRRWPRGVAR
ncbi:MAG: MYXO-CTERM sorting domain-containing protein [Myxococcota bacterium]|jgi:hypothetical protein|nr:MYXO-CTERM sorting domain-containing protein [Myxococcota bacterium]